MHCCHDSGWNDLIAGYVDLCDSKVVENLVWNLRTWPLELIEWPVENSHRLDISFNREQDRFVTYCLHARHPVAR